MRLVCGLKYDRHALPDHALMQYVSVPIDLLEIGKTIPVDLWDKTGKLLLRRGHSLRSEQHREMLAAHDASMTEGDALAWTRGYERMLHAMLRDGSSAEEISRLTMPGEIPDSDFLDEVEDDMPGGWLGLRDRLQGQLYQAPSSGSDGLASVEQLRHKALDLLQREADECLFVLCQALADPALGYCATHALLSAVVCELTGIKLGTAAPLRKSLFRAALMMNVGMARAQDALATQNAMPSEVQRTLIRDHPRIGVDILQAMGLDDANALDIVRWHHEPEGPSALPANVQLRHLLRVADMFVAKMAARKTRLAMSPLGAARSMVLDATGAAPVLASAVATAVGFYPPGTYVQLVNGERAVVVKRGPRAHDAHVVSIVGAGGMPLLQYLHRDVRESHFAIRAPVNAEKIRVQVNFERAYLALAEGRG
jgi:hypothetical protein